MYVYIYIYIYIKQTTPRATQPLEQISRSELSWSELGVRPYHLHRLNGYLARRVPVLSLASSFRRRLSCAVLKCTFPWRWGSPWCCGRSRPRRRTAGRRTYSVLLIDHLLIIIIISYYYYDCKRCHSYYYYDYYPPDFAKRGSCRQICLVALIQHRRFCICSFHRLRKESHKLTTTTH